MDKLKKYIQQARRKLSAQAAHAGENWGQAEIRKARDLIPVDHYREGVELVKAFEKWIDEQ